jgi:hypothetical protein
VLLVADQQPQDEIGVKIASLSERPQTLERL